MNENFNDLKPKPRKFPVFFWTILIVFLIFFGVVFAKAYNFGNKVFVNNTSVFQKIKSVLFHGAAGSLKGENNDRVNILLLGYGGEGHDGPYLTDSMILMSIEPSDKKILLSSIPRDYYWPPLAQKINYAYFSGFDPNKNANQGGEAALKAVSQLSGLDIPYFASVDFSGFEKAVDRIGGIDVNVETTFTDSQYPNANDGYLPPITFTAGMEHMNGARALEFARSRHGSNGEDSDFARSKRQGKIIAAFKDKVQKLGILSDTGTINDLINILADHAHTNMDPAEVLRLAKIMRGGEFQTINQSLDLDTNLICDKIDPVAGYIITPCPGVSSSTIQDFFINGLDQIKTEAATVIVENAGNDFEAYNNFANELTAKGIQVYKVGYKGLPLQQSALYEVSSKPATISYLEGKLGVTAQPKPKEMTAKTDAVIFFVNK